MRLLLSLVPLLLVTIPACEDARVDDPVSATDPVPPQASGRTTTADAGAVPQGIRVGGLAFTDEGLPIEGRPIALVDARGERFDVLTDEGGGFWFMDVKPPYDLVVAAAPSGSVVVPTVFLGLSTAAPHVELYEHEGGATRPPSQTLRLAVRCPAPPCAISVVSTSPSGGGASASSVATTDGDVAVLEIDHAWNASVIPANEAIALHVLTSDPDRTAFAYALRKGIAAAPGDVVDLGTVDAEPIAASDPLEVRAIGRAIPDGFTTVLSTWLDLPGGGAVSLGYDAASDVTMRLPLVAGGSFRATAWMQRSSADDPPYAYEGAQAWSGVRALAGGAITLEPSGAPSPARPLPGGTMSRRGLGIGFIANPPSSRPLTEVTITNVAHGSLRWRAFTNDSEIPNARLDRLGLRPLDPGAHVLGLTTTPNRTVDELVSEDASARHARFDIVRAGAASYRRFAFTVTP